MTELDPQSITFTQIENEQIAYLDSKPDSNVWRDRYNHSSGSIELELNAIVSAHLLRRVLLERKEAYLHEADLISSVIGLANNLGYSAKRPTNSRVRLKVLPNQTLTVNKFDVVGIIKDTSLIALETKTFLENQLTYIDCIVGDKKTATLTALSSDLDLFRFVEQNVSEDIRLFIETNNVIQEIDFSSKILDLENDKFIAITNPYTSIDLMYLNRIGSQYYYDSGSIITLEYIEAKDLDYELNLSQVTFFYGIFYPTTINPTSNDTQVLIPYRDMEDILSISINAPLYFESQGKIRGRNDFKKNFKILGGGTLSDTNGFDLSPALVQLTYVKTDKTLLTNTEKTNYISQLNDLTNYGVFIESILDPIQVSYKLLITLKQYTGVDISNVMNDVNEILAYEHKDNLPPRDNTRLKLRESSLEHNLSLDQIEHELVRIENIRTNQSPIQIARVQLDVSSRVIGNSYIRGDFIKLVPDNGLIYECMKPGITSANNSEFPLSDGTLFIEGLLSWQDQFSYNVGDYVKTLNTPSPFIFKCVQAGTSGLFEPSWNQTLNQDIKTIDNDVLWVAIRPLDIIGYLVWKCRNKDIRDIDIQWNEYLDLSFGNLIWQ